MPTPNLYVDAASNPFADVPPHVRTSKVELLYATDRRPVDPQDGAVAYGHERSTSLAFGSCVVEIGEGVSWDTLVANSRVRQRTVSLPLAVRQISEAARLPSTPMPLVKGKDGLVVAPAVEARRDAAAEKIRQELRKRLALTPRKEAFVYVHGVFNTFDSAASTLAGLWHFLGRQGVPIIYTWPAGHTGGFMRAYLYDRESSEFTVHHLKQLIRTLASCQELRKIHIISHSRGTDVATSALRELIIESRGAGVDPQARFKIGHVVLAAPDLDLDVVMQRGASERFFTGVENLTIYVSQGDQVIGLADWLFESRRRMGQLRKQDISSRQTKLVAAHHRTQIIDARVKAESGGHDYFHSHPAVSSDLILLLRDNRAPGAANGRPLVKDSAIYWQLSEDYPHATPRQ